MAKGNIPGYIRENQPVPMGARAPWYKNTAPTYAGIMLWFVFWQDVPTGGSGPGGGVGPLSQGLGVALGGLVIAALICHFLFYLVPGLFGMKTGRPLYIVGTSTYGAKGGFLMPGFLMGILQFGWLGVNAYFASMAISVLFGETPNPMIPKIIAVIWTLAAAFIGLKGIKYVAQVATYFPLIPLVILVVLLVNTAGGLGDFDAQELVDKAATDANAIATAAATEAAAATAAGAENAAELTKAAEAKKAAAEAVVPLSVIGVIALFITYIVGFFATAGAAGVDFGMNNPDGKNVQMGGLVGIALATIIAGGVALLAAAGGFAQLAPTDTVTLTGSGGIGLQPASAPFMTKIMSGTSAKVFAILLAVAAFPPACFSSFIAANSFKYTLPNVNPFISVGVGAAVSILLAVTGWAGDVIAVFTVIGASFGPICGAMMVDYLMSGRKWAGPRAGFNLAGWISWILGFVVGMGPLIKDFAPIPVLKDLPAAPLFAFLVGAVLYGILAGIGLQSKTLDLDAPAGDTEEAAA